MRAHGAGAHSIGARVRASRAHSGGAHGRGDELGAGSVLALAVCGAVVALAMALAAVGAVLVAQRRAAGAADAAALAAADALAGFLSDEPCDAASRVAQGNGTVLDACVVDGLVATVRVRASSGPVSLRASATAGPPPAGSSIARAASPGRAAFAPGSAPGETSGPGVGNCVWCGPTTTPSAILFLI